jgi:hypothetical protein
VAATELISASVTKTVDEAASVAVLVTISMSVVGAGPLAVTAVGVTPAQLHAATCRFQDGHVAEA